MTLTLRDLKPFAEGGNRLCFVHPENPDLCVKVRRPDYTLADLRRSKGFPRNLKPLSSFDDNLEELKVMQRLQAEHGDRIYQHVSRCHGMQRTDLGNGLVSELIRDRNGPISLSVKMYLYEFGSTDDFTRELDRFCAFWEQYCVPSRQLLLHNLVAQRDQSGGVSRLVAIDAMGESALIPQRWWPRSWQRQRVEQKTQLLRQRVERWLREIAAGKTPSKMGRLLHDGTAQACQKDQI